MAFLALLPRTSRVQPTVHELQAVKIIMNVVQYKSVSLLKNTVIYFFSYFFNLIAQLSVCLGSDDAVLQCLFSHPWEMILDPLCAIGAAKVMGAR